MEKTKNKYEQPKALVIPGPDVIMQVPQGSDNQEPTSLDAKFEEESTTQE